jgi:hypothetical protein
MIHGQAEPGRSSRTKHFLLPSKTYLSNCVKKSGKLTSALRLIKRNKKASVQKVLPLAYFLEACIEKETNVLSSELNVFLYFSFYKEY